MAKKYDTVYDTVLLKKTAKNGITVDQRKSPETSVSAIFAGL